MADAGVQLVASYPFLGVLWSMLVVFAWVIWFWLLIMIFSDVFRRRDISGVKKTVWLVFVILLPFVGVFTYLIVNSEGIADRHAERARAHHAEFEDYVKSVADQGSGEGAAQEIERAKALLDSGAITQSEYNTIKRKALSE